MRKIFEEYPEIAEIVDMDKPKSLTEDECKILIELLHTKELIDDIGIREVYCQGCWDCVKYLKMLNVLTELKDT